MLFCVCCVLRLSHAHYADLRAELIETSSIGKHKILFVLKVSYVALPETKEHTQIHRLRHLIVDILIL